MNNQEVFKPEQKHVMKFIVMSIIGVFLFLAPIPDGEGAFNIPLGIAIDWTNDNIFRQVTVVET